MAQAGNKNIDNASGQVVRLDIQNTVKAVATHNFGSRNNAGTILPCEFLADDDTNKLLIRKSTGGDQANPNPSSGTAADFFTVGDLDTENLGLLPRSGGALTGNLQLPNGTRAAPSLNVGENSGTGLYRSATNTLAFTSGGSLKMILNNTALTIVGTDTAGAKLRFREKNSQGNDYVQFKCPSTLDDDVNLTLPSSLGTPTNDANLNGLRVLKTDSSGVLSFQSVDANDLAGTVLKSTIHSSNLQSVGTLGSLTVTNTCTAGTFSGSGASLTSLPAAQLTGTVADARITTLTASKLTGALPAIDGSNLTGISQAVRRIKQASLAANVETEFNGDDFQNHLSVTFDNVPSDSRFVVFTSFEIKSESTQGGAAQAKIAVTNGNLLLDRVVSNNDTDYDDGQFTFMEFDVNSNTDNRTYALQVRSTSSISARGARIRNACIIVLEFGV